MHTQYPTYLLGRECRYTHEYFAGYGHTRVPLLPGDVLVIVGIIRVHRREERTHVIDVAVLPRFGDCSYQRRSLCCRMTCKFHKFIDTSALHPRAFGQILLAVCDTCWLSIWRKKKKKKHSICERRTYFGTNFSLESLGESRGNRRTKPPPMLVQKTWWSAGLGILADWSITTERHDA